MVQFSWDCTFFIRRSTGRLCADLIPSNTGHWHYDTRRTLVSSPFRLTSWDPIHQEPTAISCLTLEQYHRICTFRLSERRSITISSPQTVTLGSVIRVSNHEGLVEIAFPPDIELHQTDWSKESGKVMQNGWTR